MTNKKSKRGSGSMDTIASRTIGTMLGFCIALFTKYVGGIDNILCTLLVCMACNVIIGTLVAVYKKKFSLGKFGRGAAINVVILILVIVTNELDQMLHANGILRQLLIFYYIAYELLSCLDNAKRLGVPVPSWLIDLATKIKSFPYRDIVNAILDSFFSNLQPDQKKKADIADQQKSKTKANIADQQEGIEK